MKVGFIGTGSMGSLLIYALINRVHLSPGRSPPAIEPRPKYVSYPSVTPVCMNPRAIGKR